MSEKFPNTSNGYTGKLIEEEIFGKCGGSWDGKTFFNYSDSLEYAKNNQPPGWRLSDPVPKFAGNLFYSVAVKLGLEDWSELKLYSAVGTPLDVFHGVDAFFEYNGTMVTLDLTINDKKETYKADFVINSETTDPEVMADGIVSRMNNRMNRKVKVA